jgi:DNA polymerase-3 subunit chi
LTDIGFYHLTRSPLDEALPRLLEKAYAGGHRVVVRGGDPERIELLNRALWTYGKDSFLPHGVRSDGFAEDQPIYLTAQVENPNGATILIRVDEADAPDLDAFDRCLDLFDGHDEEAVARARDFRMVSLGAVHECVPCARVDEGNLQQLGSA